MKERDIERLQFPLPGNRTFDEIIDVRAPIEFAIDHMTGAINLPVLWDDEREQIGARYKQVSAFEAKKAGAALVSENIGRHLDEHFSKKPRDYCPLIYCFRGGQRSRSLATVLTEIGWPAAVIEGGYKAYRKQVIDVIETKPPLLDFHVINGLTGSGKTLILQALDSLGAQVLDLEGLANHKGSVFGRDHENPQPSQKQFETLIYDQLASFDDSSPVFVEAESPKIGRLNLPLPLRKELGESPVTEIVSSLESRVEFLHRDYESWLSDPDWILDSLDRLKPFHRNETISRWRSWCEKGQWPELIGDLLEEHYDRFYKTGGDGNYREPAARYELSDQTDARVAACAKALLEAAKRNAAV